MNRYTIPLPEALRLAAKRQAERLTGIQADLNDLVAAGCEVNITAVQLLRLEDAGLLYDFESGLVEDFHQAPDNPDRGIVSAVNRQVFFTQVAQTLERPSLPEITAEMTATL